MQTNFSAQQLSDLETATSEGVIRKCVHCGFCTATCPTYVLLGDELDSPRGRIYLIKDMLENDREPTAEVVKHIDRCLSCLSCVSTCPSGVNYMHLIDHARSYIEKRHRRPMSERFWRAVLAGVLPYPGRFRLALSMARLARPLAGLFRGPPAAMLALAPRSRPARQTAAQEATASRKGRVILQRGCAEPVLQPSIRAAALRLLARCGYEVAPSPVGEGCCGALTHHLGREADALAFARRDIDAWTAEIGAGLDAILVTASGCGTTIKNYGHLFRGDPAYADKAARVSALAMDITEFLQQVGLPAPSQASGLTVAYHAACSLQHGQQVKSAPKALLTAAGFAVGEPSEAHLCCGSAGTYNILQPQIAERLRDRKAANLARLNADVIAAGNIGCLTQIAQALDTPVVHTVELLDWATGGPIPPALSSRLLNRA